ncbi:MAG: hypothetical protein O2816_00010 [Planctomycetota bacterium]|nr:hypothetical protein [Planctomycetota bacterium]
MNLRPLCAAVVLLGVASCKASQYSAINPFSKQAPETMLAPADDPNGWGTGVPRTDDTVYGWDGAPVGSGTGPMRSPGAGTVQVTSGGMNHTLAGSDGTGGSRLVLLESYSLAVEEREELALQVEVLNAALEQSERRFGELDRRYAELERGYATLATEKTAVEEQRRELAARLTTAQIRRLQAEKAWLQSAIEWRDFTKLNDTARRRLATEGEGSQP